MAKTIKFSEWHHGENDWQGYAKYFAIIILYREGYIHFGGRRDLSYLNKV